MGIFDALTLAGGLSLFLFGMSVMSEALERRAEGSLKLLLARLTQSKTAGFLTGLIVTAVIQSSSAATVMVVGFVNSGVMTLKQAINVIMGANVGTTVTAWLLSLSGISSDSFFIRMLKPTSFTPILATVGTVLFMFGKTSKKKDTGTILLGFSTLMFGMDTMSGSVAGLADVPAFQQLFILFKNPVLGIIVGAVLTAVIQSSSASVGILQALASTGQVSYGAAMPIIMGQNIGTCATALLSSFGTTKNARRAAVVHLSFNIMGTLILLLVFLPVSLFLKPPLLNEPASLFGIALTHSAFNILSTFVLLPASSLLEKLAVRLVPDAGKDEEISELDERLLAAPHIALDRCYTLVQEMAEISTSSMKNVMELLTQYDKQRAKEVREAEEKCDHYEDILGTYLVKLSSYQMSDADSGIVSMMLKVIGDLERISDHSINILESAEELREKKIQFTDEAKRELEVLCGAVSEIMTLSCTAFMQNDLDLSRNIEPLEQVIDDLKEAMRNAHVLRLKKGVCSIETGFIWLDLLTSLERAADHCSNIAICIVDAAENSMNLHHSLSVMKEESSYYKTQYAFYSEKYALPKIT
ncbi:MAG: Na/Pi cotransporter family protein [Lachnospiraceae bacterium]|nr:Na/Pi cotransporter family protein [Lachnospiraceae bacterium]